MGEGGKSLRDFSLETDNPEKRIASISWERYMRNQAN